MKWRFCVDVRCGNRNALVTDKVADAMRGADARPRRGSRKDGQRKFDRTTISLRRLRSAVYVYARGRLTRLADV